MSGCKGSSRSVDRKPDQAPSSWTDLSPADRRHRTKHLLLPGSIDLHFSNPNFQGMRDPQFRLMIRHGADTDRFRRFCDFLIPVTKILGNAPSPASLSSIWRYNGFLYIRQKFITPESGRISAASTITAYFR